MSRQEAREKAWNTFRENMIQRAIDDPEHGLEELEEFLKQRIYSSYGFWRDARAAERNRDFKKARVFYLKTVESLEQAERLADYPAADGYVKKFKDEYYDFVVHRDPCYRLNLTQLLPLIKEEAGILQTETYKRLQLSKPEITYTLYFAEKEGLIRREEKGRSYLLYFERDKPDDEPLLTIQDDEIDIQEKAEQEAAARKGCLFIFVCFFWIAAFMVAGAYTGLVGAGIVVAAFIVWSIFRKVRQKKQATTESATPTTEVVQPQEPPENTNENAEGEKQ